MEAPLRMRNLDDTRVRAAEFGWVKNKNSLGGMISLSVGEDPQYTEFRCEFFVAKEHLAVERKDLLYLHY